MGRSKADHHYGPARAAILSSLGPPKRGKSVAPADCQRRRPMELFFAGVHLLVVEIVLLELVILR